MAAEEVPALPGGLARVARNPISRRQIEITLARSAAIFGVLFAGLTIGPLMEQWGQMRPAWTFVVVLGVFGGLLAAVVASLARRGTVAVNSYVTVSWFLAMLSWPLGVADLSEVSGERPWLWGLTTVATTTAAIAWPLWAATVALVVLPMTYGVVRITPAGGGSGFEIATLDVVYAVILGGATLMIITLLRQAAATVDQAQATALDRYANAVRQHATEVERVQVDAIVHDSVLTTLLSAARADTPSAQQLAAQMASNAMQYLKDAESSPPDDDGVVSMTDLAERIHASSSEVGARFAIEGGPLSDAEISAHSAEAVHSAAVQAMLNSAQHGGTDPAIRRWLDTRVTADGVFTVEVGDTGVGFDRSSIPTARLGLRVSIVERVMNAGGHVRIESSPGNGTVITISCRCREEDASDNEAALGRTVATLAASDRRGLS